MAEKWDSSILNWAERNKEAKEELGKWAAFFENYWFSINRDWASPTYDRAMKKAGLNQVCHNPKDWIDQIEKLINDNQYRETTGIRAREFAEKEYHTNKVIEQWDKIFINHFS